MHKNISKEEKIYKKLGFGATKQDIFAICS
jgi:hypothetical protein